MHELVTCIIAWLPSESGRRGGVFVCGLVGDKGGGSAWALGRKPVLGCRAGRCQGGTAYAEQSHRGPFVRVMGGRGVLETCLVDVFVV